MLNQDHISMETCTVDILGDSLIHHHEQAPRHGKVALSKTKSTAASQETKKEAAEAQRPERSGSHKQLQLDTNATRSCTATPPRSSARRSTILHIYQIFVWLMAIFTPRFPRPAYSRSYFQMSKPN
ncbi:hypothetical protein D6D02_05120 [Aureobasidium pullulans]|uniref:Uncharacterized protein n=2 Tax=Aureobasidium pullulans TaxID=5580 RepID=A0A4S8UZ95_AURPU|nr:hypothetical protein D6D28_05906 [Aureobasidium pullulans]THW03280.1 hypothetical protein D6D26_03624 [Aureobasidium pullulans]THX36179.1 hypothetical protein D6D10_06906 [Aureobasidium pullulans]THY12585.1 hypothetical protein D6D02_05120 [Aureobasidium pullulans]THY59127.1 hypothetical protein D6C97_04191 [Aureobasidium pullulans]